MHLFLYFYCLNNLSTPIVRPPNNDSDKDLLRQVAEGSESAFRVLYDRYFNKVAAYVFKLSKSETIAEEILQEVFLKLWTGRDMLDNIETPEAYIMTMARNRTTDYLRRLARETNLIDALQTVVARADNSTEEKLDADDLQAIIAHALLQLSDQKQKVFDLNMNKGFSHDEIAEAMQLSKSTVKNHLSETLKYLRKEVQDSPHKEALLLLLTLRSLL